MCVDAKKIGAKRFYSKKTQLCLEIGAQIFQIALLRSKLTYKQVINVSCLFAFLVDCISVCSRHILVENVPDSYSG